MGATDPALQLVCALLVMLVPTSMVMIAPSPHRSRVFAVIAAGVAGVTASIVIDLAFSSTVDLPGEVFDAAAAGAVTASVAVLAARRLGSLGGGVFAATWGLVVFQPAYSALVGTVPSLVQTVFGAVDFGGVLATHVAAASSLIVLSVLPAPRRRSQDGRPAVSHRRAVIAAPLMVIGATAWMLGLERVVSETSGRILSNALAGLVLGALVWVLVERIAGHSLSPMGTVAGVVTAWGSIGLGVAFLSPMALVASTVFGVAGAAAVVIRARPQSDHGRRGAIAVIVAVAIGGTVLALLADGFGMAATGSTALVAGQLGALLTISVGAAGSGVLCWGFGVASIVALERARTHGLHRKREAD